MAGHQMSGSYFPDGGFFGFAAVGAVGAAGVEGTALGGIYCRGHFEMCIRDRGRAVRVLPADRPGEFVNVNTPGEYQALLTI